MKWLVRVLAGVSLGLIASLFLSGNTAPGMGRVWAFIVVAILALVAWYEAPDRKKFEDDFFDSNDDDRRGPPGLA